MLDMVSLTSLLDTPRARREWAALLPRSPAFVREANRAVPKAPRIPPSPWTRAARLWSTVGQALDYALAAGWLRKPLTPVFERAAMGSAPALGLAVAVERTIVAVADEADRLRRGDGRRLSARLVRGLALLALFDAMFRAAVPPPDWLLEAHPWTERRLTAAVAGRFPEPFVLEVRRLYAAARTDLPRPTRGEYNPTFGSPRVGVGADGDFLVGRTLVELKVTIDRGICVEQLRQLLAYAALDRLHGRARVGAIAVYNPRFRHWWSGRLDATVAGLGGGTFEDVVEWVARRLPAQARAARRRR